MIGFTLPLDTFELMFYDIFMTTEKQIQANRKNGKLGGVKTEKGKADSSMNALSHGLLSKRVLLRGENGRLLTELRQRFLAEFEPRGELETVLVERIVSSLWRLRRSLGAENGSTKGSPFYGTSSWDTCIRYEAAIERQIYKALHELERLQKARTGLDLTVSLGDLNQYPETSKEFLPNEPNSNPALGAQPNPLTGNEL